MKRVQRTRLTPSLLLRHNHLNEYLSQLYSTRLSRSYPAIKIDPDLSTSAYCDMAIRSVLTGMGQLIAHTSAGVVNSLMGACEMPTFVADRPEEKQGCKCV